VIDGDTLVVAGRSVRLHGIDAPERTQLCADEGGRDWACGGWAQVELTRQVAGRIVVCDGQGTDRYGRVLAICRVAGRDLGRVLVAKGAAFAYRRYSRDYVDEEDRARLHGQGLWLGGAENPAKMRARSHAEPPPGCRIKGNVSANGRVYHLPGSASYDGTRISLARGERWFCSERAARSAGWRAAGR
jgi:endonuclease YncB( thermonuclease family)